MNGLAFNDRLGPGAEVDKNGHQHKKGSENWQGHIEDFILVLHKLFLPLLFLPGVFFRFSFQLSHDEASWNCTCCTLSLTDAATCKNYDAQVVSEQLLT